MTEKVLQQLAIERSYNRGLSYFGGGAVRNQRTDSQTLYGDVAGSQDQDYQVRLYLHPPYDYQCTCLYSDAGACKHVVALGLSWLEEPETFRDITIAVNRVKEELKEALSALSHDALLEIMAELLFEEPQLKSRVFHRINTERSC